MLRSSQTQIWLCSHRSWPESLNFSYRNRRDLTRNVRKPAFCICENKDADQLRCNPEADQRLCFRYTDSTIPLLPKSEITSLQPSSLAVQPGLCRTWSETPKTGFLRTRLILLPLERKIKGTGPSVCTVGQLICEAVFIYMKHLGINQVSCNINTVVSEQKRCR